MTLSYERRTKESHSKRDEHLGIIPQRLTTYSSLVV